MYLTSAATIPYTRPASKVKSAIIPPYTGPFLPFIGRHHSLHWAIILLNDGHHSSFHQATIQPYTGHLLLFRRGTIQPYIGHHPYLHQAIIPPSNGHHPSLTPGHHFAVQRATIQPYIILLRTGPQPISHRQLPPSSPPPHSSPTLSPPPDFPTGPTRPSCSSFSSRMFANALVVPGEMQIQVFKHANIWPCVKYQYLIVMGQPSSYVCNGNQLVFSQTLQSKNLNIYLTGKGGIIIKHH
jgi:hypothetical protein